ncbi:hypothetical protein [Marinobacter sp.]|uniref:hypothetical protein n=1 Tax=Marinobacter sp. TaxID=50741 RepID=UPI003A8F524F
MNLRIVGTIGTFLLVVLGLMNEVGDYSFAEFFAFLGFGTTAALIAWFKLFKPGSRREGN